MGNKATKSPKTRGNDIEIIWERCCELYLQAENGNNESFKELEDISQNNQNDAVCLGYLWRLLWKADSIADQDKIGQIRQQILEIVTNLKSNSSSFKQFIQNLSNKHQQFIFGCFFRWGIGVEQNIEEYFRLLRLSADQDHVLAEYELGYDYEYGIGMAENKQLSFEYFMRAATKGYSIAQCKVGYCYEEGSGVDKDENEALEWYKKSAESGCPGGCFTLGECYFLGIGTEVNEEEAMKWFQISAEKEHFSGLKAMGLFYHYGIIVEKDRNKSTQLFEKAAENRWGFEAKYLLGVHYLQDESQTKGFEILNETRHPDERVIIAFGLCFEFGLGTEKSSKTAFEYYSETNYFPSVKYHVGRCYEEGIGGKVNVNEARRLFKEAARGNDRYEGDVDAKNKLREFEEDKVRVRFRKKQFW